MTAYVYHIYIFFAVMLRMFMMIWRWWCTANPRTNQWSLNSLERSKFPCSE